MTIRKKIPLIQLNGRPQTICNEKGALETISTSMKSRQGSTYKTFHHRKTVWISMSKTCPTYRTIDSKARRRLCQSITRRVSSEWISPLTKFINQERPNNQRNQRQKETTWSHLTDRLLSQTRLRSENMEASQEREANLQSILEWIDSRQFKHPKRISRLHKTQICMVLLSCHQLPQLLKPTCILQAYTNRAMLYNRLHSLEIKPKTSNHHRTARQ